MRKISLFICLIAFVTACQTSPANKQYNEATLDTDIAAAISEKNLDEDQIVQVENYLNMARSEERVEELLTAKTYGQIIDDAMDTEISTQESAQEVSIDNTQVTASDTTQTSSDSTQVVE